MKPRHYSDDTVELIVLQRKLCLTRVNCAKMEEACNTECSAIMEQISALTLRRINTFPRNVPCTLGKLSNTVDVSMEQVEHHMIRTIPSNRMYDRSMYDLVDIIDTIIPNKIYTDLVGIHFVMQPNWVFTKSGSDNIHIERIEMETSK